MMRGLAVKYLGDIPKTRLIIQMIQQFEQKASASALSRGVKTVNLQISFNKRSDQKSPDGSLMVGCVTLTLGAGASFLITRVGGA
jgi:hypothetical protein